jgi:antitoxin component YwqK of YwqJK toxin-antitoxin module
MRNYIIEPNGKIIRKKELQDKNVQQGVETNWYEKDDRENLLFLQRTNKFLISSYKEW